MATEVAEAAAPETEDASAETAGRKLPLSSKTIKIAVLLAAVMGVQVAIGYFLIPSPAAPDPADPDAALISAEERNGVDKADIVEVEVGSFDSTNSNAIEGTEIHVSFTVSATVSNKNQLAFEDAVQHVHPARIKQAIERVTRSSSIENLNDPDLDVIKRKIREDVNKVLGKSYIIEVIISEYKTMHH